MSALSRVQGDCSFYLKVGSARQRSRPEGRDEFTIQGICDSCIAVSDLATLLEARFSTGATVTLSGTGQRIVADILKEVEGVKAAAKAQTDEAVKRIEDVSAFARDLDAREKALDEDPRVQAATRRVVELNQEIANRKAAMETEVKRHHDRLAREELPDDFDANRFPEAEDVALATVERWKETLDDPSELVGGDYTELENILTTAMQKLAMKVADRYTGLVDV